MDYKHLVKLMTQLQYSSTSKSLFLKIGTLGHYQAQIWFMTSNGIVIHMHIILNIVPTYLFT